MKNPTLLVLAAGLGSRYGSLKQIDQFGPSGETIIDYSIYDAIAAGFKKVVFVIRQNIEEEFKEVFYGKFSKKIEVEYALQELDVVPPGSVVSPTRTKPWGTGHAVMVAEDKISDPFAVINADDFYGRKSFQMLFEALKGFDGIKPQCCIVAFRLQNTISAHGHVARGIITTDDAGNLSDITEHTHIYYDGNTIYDLEENGTKKVLPADALVSMNLMGFTPDVFGYFRERFKQYLASTANDDKTEFFLPDVVKSMIRTGYLEVQLLETPEKWFGVTYKEDKPVAMQRLRYLVREGVYPESLWGKH
jgi:dTDP-glucose pyrophosphorylase